MDNGGLFAVILIVWIIAIVMMKKLKMFFFKFFVGSLGLFTIAMIFFMSPLENILTDYITKVLLLLSSLFSGYEVIPDLSLISINSGDGIITMFINYECSGIIELLVYSSLVIFFPFLTFKRKVSAFLLGNAYIFAINIIRILFIIIVVQVFGIDSFYLAHTVIARIIFFILIIILYYKVFTKNQIKNQKVGDLDNE